MGDLGAIIGIVVMFIFVLVIALPIFFEKK